jgi:hypothetical protein
MFTGLGEALVRRFPVFLIVLSLLGCAESMDRITATDFEPTGAKTFKFKGPAGPQYPVNTAGGEASRMAMLDGWMARNPMCRAGYDITSRIPVERTMFVSDVYYEGRCRD